MSEQSPYLARPWLQQYALPAVLAQVPDTAPKGLTRKDVEEQVRTVFDVLGCLRGYTSATYREDDAIVTHAEFVVQDLK